MNKIIEKKLIKIIEALEDIDDLTLEINDAIDVDIKRIEDKGPIINDDIDDLISLKKDIERLYLNAIREVNLDYYLNK